jgi:hypothetical protein
MLPDRFCVRKVPEGGRHGVLGILGLVVDPTPHLYLKYTKFNHSSLDLGLSSYL